MKLNTAVTVLFAASNVTAQECSNTYMNGALFEVAIVSDTNSSATATKRQTHPALLLHLQNGVLTDTTPRTGYIAANDQFQFDDPPQAGALIVDGFAVCNGLLALRSSTTWYECQSGSYFNLYDKDIGSVCYEIRLAVIEQASSASADSTPTATPTAASQAGNNTSLSISVSASATASSSTSSSILNTATLRMLTQISDGQVQDPTAAPYPASQSAAAVDTVASSYVPAPTNGSLTPFNPNAGVILGAGIGFWMAFVCWWAGAVFCIETLP